MIEPLLVTSSLLLGKEFINQTITKTTANIYTNIDSILVDSNFELKTLLEDLDINTKIDIINTFICSCNFKENLDKYSEAVKKTLNYIADILKKIENEIEKIKIESENHKEKWFYYIRTPKYKPIVNNLVKHLKILEDRFNFLINLLKIEI